MKSAQPLRQSIPIAARRPHRVTDVNSDSDVTPNDGGESGVVRGAGERAPPFTLAGAEGCSNVRDRGIFRNDDSHRRVGRLDRGEPDDGGINDLGPIYVHGGRQLPQRVGVCGEIAGHNSIQPEVIQQLQSGTYLRCGIVQAIQLTVPPGPE